MYSPPEIAKNYIEDSKQKVKIPLLKLLLLGVYGGFFISSAVMCAIICSYRMLGGESQFYSGLVFPMGILFCFYAGGELFTADCLLVIPLFCKKISIIEMLKLWGIVYIGNFLGAFIMALLVVYGHVPNLFENNIAQSLVSYATLETTIGFGDAFVKGILCNVFICLSVWLSFGGKDFFSKMAGLWSPILLYIGCGYEHCVSNMFLIPAGLFSSYEYHLTRDKLNWGRLFYKSLIPVTLGNICGGVILVGFGYWYIYLTPESLNVPPPIENKNPNPNIEETQNKAIN